MPKEDIEFIDRLLAKTLLVAWLRRIPEFLDLWNRERAKVEPYMDTIFPAFQQRLAAMSPEGRGAFMSSGGEGWHLCGEDAVREATEMSERLQDLCKDVNEAAERDGLSLDYTAQLESLVEPLGVPGLVECMEVWDWMDWGFDRRAAWPIEGPARSFSGNNVLRGND